ncbi:MAG: radical SAM protein [Chloroflexi bacterium]|nr:MAG: radical SAM protein [Chloroflexota bacterium]MBL1197299.1 radical SAM protein [Chloroflexota bacterium]NOH14595.1 radical SAM protein [Chloroflexota bacterium]
MKIIASTGNEDIAMVYIVDLDDNRLVECVEAVQPPIPREEKWVLMVSTMCGCPVGCAMCDAGGLYRGKLSADEVFSQIDFLVKQRYPDFSIPSKQFKIQFARMGEPTLNPAVLDVLGQLQERYNAPGMMPSFSTIAPAGREEFFERLLEIKQDRYREGQFQFQFSVHTTDTKHRDEIIPVRKWGFDEMAAYGQRFYQPGDRKITLNFALAQDMPLDPEVLNNYFDPDLFLIKITPLNPTYRAKDSGLSSYIDPLGAGGDDYPIVKALRETGYQVILSIGEVEENYIGSNCGQYVQQHLQGKLGLDGGYTYEVVNL